MEVGTIPVVDELLAANERHAAGCEGAWDGSSGPLGLTGEARGADGGGA